MQTPLSEMLSTIETLTCDAERECLTDMCRTLALIKARGVAIEQLAGFIADSRYAKPAELERIKHIERSGANLLGSIQKRREELHKALCGGARQRSFAACVTGILNPRLSRQSFTL